MLAADTPLIQDIDHSLRYCQQMLEVMRQGKTLPTDHPEALLLSLGLRFAESSAVDALLRGLLAIAQDLDGGAPEDVRELLAQLRQGTTRRPPFLTNTVYQHFLLVYTLSVAAQLPLLSGANAGQLDEQKRASSLIAKTLSQLCKEMEHMRKWCMENVEV